MSVLLLSLAFASVGAERVEIDNARVSEIARWLPAHPAGFGWSLTNRPAWEKLARLPAFAGVVTEAEGLAKKPVPELPDELYLDYSRTGNRDRCQKVLGSRDRRLVTLALAECLEAHGRFIAPLAESIKAVCQERTWVLPAHDGKLENFNGKAKQMDLRATAVAWDLAMVDYLVGDSLPEAARTQLRNAVRSRVLEPFREMIEGKRPAISWLRATHNWNAVCLAGVTGAALALEETPADRAWFVAVAERYIRFFLSGFTPDGYCSEGIGYWNYGYGRFILLSEAVRQATGGHVDLFADPAAVQPALYSVRTEIANGVYPTIADCHPGSQPDPLLVRFVSERLRLPLPPGLNAEFQKPSGSLFSTMMFSSLPLPLPPVAQSSGSLASPLRTWFTNGGVLICRPETGVRGGFAVALKGGHNAEHHNHNDVGSFSIVVGKSMVICDPGSEIYTARTFSGHRYDSKVLNSFGHAVPVIAGKWQQTGIDAKAVVLRTDFNDQRDTLALDLRSAYGVPELKRLERTFTYQRSSGPGLTVEDRASFATPQTFETALVTWGRWQQTSANELLVTDGADAVRVRIDTGGKKFKVSATILDEDLPGGRKPTRLGLALDEPATQATVTMVFAPAGGADKDLLKER